MPRYNYGGSGPADWAQFQQSRRDDQIRNILNLMMSNRDFKADQGWKQKDYEAGLANDEFSRGQTERRTAASELSANSLANQRGEEDPVIQQARVLVETGQAKDLGTALRMVKGIRTVDEELALHIAKQKADQKIGGGSDKPNAQFDESLNLQKQLTDMANDLESQITGFKRAKQDYAKGGYIDEDARARMSQIDSDISEATKRLNRARSLAVRLKPGKAPDLKVGAEIAAFLGGEVQPGPNVGAKGLIDWLGPLMGGGANPMMAQPGATQAPAPPPASAPAPTPAPEQYEPGTKRKNRKTGEVQVWTGTKWQAIK